MDGWLNVCIIYSCDLVLLLLGSPIAPVRFFFSHSALICCCFLVRICSMNSCSS